MSIEQYGVHDRPTDPLRPLTHQMLQAASGFGRIFDIRCVALVLRRTVAELLPSVHEALAAGVLVEKGTQLGFRDEAARDEAYYALPVPVRRRLHRDAADVLLSIGSTEEAAALLADERHSRSAEDGPPAEDRATFGWASLTDAELRVAGLAASGLTNRLIAEELSLSQHTIESHLRHAFRKLDIRSRVELTRVVLTHQPVADH